MAGGLHVLILHHAGAGTYKPDQSLDVFSMAVIGGLGSIGGALLGVFSLRLLEQVVSGAVRLLITGAGLLVPALPAARRDRPGAHAVRNVFLRLVAKRRGIVVPSLLADRRVRPRRGPAAVARSRAEDEVDAISAALTSGRRKAGCAAMSVAAPAAQGIDVSYGPVQVLFGVDFEVAEGEIVALLGTNGAGKSTLLKAISGLVKPTAGTIEFAGERIAGRPADVVTRSGVSLMPGGQGVFPTLTVDENLRLAGWLLRKQPDEQAAARARVLDLFPILAERSARWPATCPAASSRCWRWPRRS